MYELHPSQRQITFSYRKMFTPQTMILLKSNNLNLLNNYNTIKSATTVDPF